MESITIWVSLFIGVLVPLVGWVFNSIITKKIDDLESQSKDTRKLFFEKLDIDRKAVEDHYVRKDMYEQALKFNNENNDERYKSLIVLMSSKFENVEDKIEEIRKLINEKFNGKDKVQHG